MTSNNTLERERLAYQTLLECWIRNEGQQHPQEIFWTAVRICYEGQLKAKESKDT